MISSMLSKRRTEEDEAEGSSGSVLMGVAGGREQGGGGGGNEMGASAADMERDLARPGWECTVGLVELSASDSGGLENARRELAFSAVRNWRI
jgi:hypothetical protein